MVKSQHGFSEMFWSSSDWSSASDASFFQLPLSSTSKCKMVLLGPICARTSPTCVCVLRPCHCGACRLISNYHECKPWHACTGQNNQNIKLIQSDETGECNVRTAVACQFQWPFQWRDKLVYFLLSLYFSCHCYFGWCSPLTLMLFPGLPGPVVWQFVG